jgi:dihydroorotase-like cyclic amidohydrolase
MKKSKKAPLPVPSATQAAIKAGIARMAEMKNGKPVVTERDMLEVQSPVYGTMAMSERMTPSATVVRTQSSPYSETVSKEQLIKDGLFVEKDGDMMPTQKFYEMKKSGKLKGKYNID